MEKKKKRKIKVTVKIPTYITYEREIITDATDDDIADIAYEEAVDMMLDEGKIDWSFKEVKDGTK